MAEINIPMRTKSSMDLDMVLGQNGEERIQPALELRELETGLARRQRDLVSNTPQNVGRQSGTQNRTQGSALQGQIPQRGALQGQTPLRSASQGQLPQRSASQGQTSQRRTGAAVRPSAVRHYDVQPKGGTVLNKGGKVSFRSLFPGNLGKIEVVMGWDAEMFSLDDVDASCYLLGENGKAVGDDWFVFYNQPSSPDGAVRHQGKSGGAKEEIITVDFCRLRPEIKRLAFVLTINEAQERGYSFSQVGNAHVRIRDSVSRRELALFNLSDYYDGVTAMTVCEFYDYHGEWKINPVGHGLKNTGLLELCRFYGVNVE